MKRVTYLMMGLALVLFGGCASIDDECYYEANDAALAWTDATALQWAEPDVVLQTLTDRQTPPKDKDVARYIELLSRGLNHGWWVNWDELLQWACIYDHRAVGKWAVQRGANPNRTVSIDPEEVFFVYDENASFDYPLLYLTSGNSRAQAFLLDVGADPNLHPNIGASPILPAIFNNDVELIKKFLAHGIDLSNSPVAGAATTVETAQLLIDHGASRRPVGNNLYSPLIFALLGGNPDVIDLFIPAEALDYTVHLNTTTVTCSKNTAGESDCTVRHTTGRELSALYVASHRIETSALEKLLDAGANPYLNDDLAFRVAYGLLYKGDADRFKRHGFTIDMTSLNTNNCGENCIPTIPMPLLQHALQSLRGSFQREKVVACANLILDLGAKTDILVHDHGRKENVPLLQWMKNHSRDFAKTPEARALYKRITGEELSPPKERRRASTRAKQRASQNNPENSHPHVL